MADGSSEMVPQVLISFGYLSLCFIGLAFEGVDYPVEDLAAE